MKRWIAILLTVAMLLGMTGFAEDLEIEDEIIVKSDDNPVDEVGLEIGDIGLSIDDIELSVENGIDGAVELAEDVDCSNASEDVDIQDGVLVKYKGPGGDVVIPDGVTRIGQNAFYYCQSLITVTIPSSVTIIEDDAFNLCTSLTKVTIPNSVTEIGSAAFAKCTSLTSVKIPSSVTAIGWSIFHSCSNLTNVTIPSSIAHIEPYSFYKCSSLTSITIPDSVTSIWDCAFAYCQNLTSITIPSSVSGFGLNIFVGCPNLTIYCEADSYVETYARDNSIPFVAGSPVPTDSPKLASKSPVIGVGETFSLIASDSPVSASQCEFTSKDKTTVAVNKKGVITGVKKGSTTVTVTPAGGKAVKVKVTVKKAPNYISLTPEEVTIGVGETIAPFRAHLTSGSASALTWSSSKRKYATVDGEGKLKGIKKGTTTITVRTFNDRKDTSEVTVKAAPKSISFPKSSVTLGLGEEVTIKANLNKNSGGSISYDILNADIAVYRDGKLKGTYTGETTLRATTYNGLTAELHVVVVNSPTKIIVPEKLFMGLKEKVPLGASVPEGTHTTLKYKSSKTSVATVNSSGMVTAKNVGTTEITVTAHNGVKAVCKVTVKKKATNFTLKPTKVELKLGETKQLKVTFKKDTAASIVWTTSDRNVATISDGGLVTAVGAGQATITAKLLSGNKKKTCKVTVKEGIPEKLDQLKEKFPDGKYWDHRVEKEGSDAWKDGDESWQDSVTDTPCAHNADTVGNYDCNCFNGKSQCYGFADKLYSEIFGHVPRESEKHGHSDVADIRMGDHVRFKYWGHRDGDENDWGHSAIVWKREGDTLTLIECNYDYKCGISWGKRTVNVNATGNDYIVGFWHADNWDEVNG